MIDIGRALRHPFDDTRWVSKFLIGGLIGIVPILQFALFGWGIRHLQQVSRGQDTTLPEWENLGDKFSLGLKLFVVVFVLLLPSIVIFLVVSVLAALASAGGDEGTAGAVAAVGVLAGLLVFVYGLLITFLSPAITIQMARTESIAACLRIGDLLAIARSNLGGYLTIVVIPLAVGFGVGFVIGVINFIPCLGQVVGIVLTIVFLVYSQALVGHLGGQFIAEAPVSARV